MKRLVAATVLMASMQAAFAVNHGHYVSGKRLKEWSKSDVVSYRTYIAGYVDGLTNDQELCIPHGVLLSTLEALVRQFLNDEHKDFADLDGNPATWSIFWALYPMYACPTQLPAKPKPQP